MGSEDSVLHIPTPPPHDWVQLLSRVRLFATPWITACQASLSITNSWSLLKSMSIESMMPSNHLILCCPLLLLPSIFPSIRDFSNESALHIRWPKYRSFSFSISPSSEHPGLISFKMDWLDLLAVHGDLESSPTPQYKSINSSALSFLYSPTLTSISFTTCKCGRMNSHNMQVQALLLIWDNLTSTSNLCLPSVRSRVPGFSLRMVSRVQAQFTSCCKMPDSLPDGLPLAFLPAAPT